MAWRTLVHLWITLMPAALKRRQMRRRIVAGGLDDLDAALDDRLAILVIGNGIDRRQDGQVDADRLVGHLAALLDFLDQQLGRARASAR